MKKFKTTIVKSYMFLVEMVKYLWNESKCKYHRSHVVSEHAWNRTKYEDDIRTECKRCNMPLILLVDDEDPDMFWICEDYGDEINERVYCQNNNGIDNVVVSGGVAGAFG